MQHHVIAGAALLLLLSSFLAAAGASAGPADVPLHDIIGKNLTTANVYFIRNYTIGSYSGKGLALLSAFRSRCAMYLAFASSPDDTGLPVSLVPASPNATVIYPGDRFKFVLASAPPCSRRAELGVDYRRRGAFVVTLGRGAYESYFSVAVDKFGRYSLQYCGTGDRVCGPIGDAGGGVFGSNGVLFNFFFQKKVNAGDADLLQSQ